MVASTSTVISLTNLRFYRDDDNRPTLKDCGFSTEWAEHAGKLAFQEVENPHEDLVVTFLNLALFWYSQGSWRRCSVHKCKY